jgi:hypothetical protein
VPLGIGHFVRLVGLSDRYHPVIFTELAVVLSNSIQSSFSPYASFGPLIFEHEYSLIITCDETGKTNVNKSKTRKYALILMYY